MSLSSASVPVGATAFTPTGGSATSFVSLGQSEGKNKLFLDDGSTLILRKTLNAVSKTPVPNGGSPNGYTQQRVILNYHYPILLSNGEYTVNTAKIEVAYDPESTAAQIASLWEMVAHMCSDADFADCREDGSVA